MNGPAFHRPLASQSAREPTVVEAEGRVWSGIALAAFGAITFSGKAIIVKLGFRHGADAITLIALRMLVALPFFLLAWGLARRRGGAAPLGTRDRWTVVALGVTGYYLASYLDFLGLQFISASLERLILYLTPTLVLMIGVVRFGKRVGRRQLAALGIGYAGALLAFAHDVRLGGSQVVLGSVLVLSSALAYAMYLVASGELVQRVGSIRLVASASCIAATCCIVHFVVTRPLALLFDQPADVYWLSLLNGTLCTVVPMFAVMMSIQRIGAPLASQIGMIGPISTILLAAIFLGETLGPYQVAGTVLVMIGVFVVSQSRAAQDDTRKPLNRRKQ